MTVQIYGNAENDWTVKQFTNAKLKLMDYGSAKYVNWGYVDGKDGPWYLFTITKEDNESFCDIPERLLDGRYCGDWSFKIINGAEVYKGKIQIVPAKPTKDYEGYTYYKGTSEVAVDYTVNYDTLPSWMKSTNNCKINKVYNGGRLDLPTLATEIDTTKIDFSKLTTGKYLFYGLTQVKGLDLTNLDTSAFSDFSYMFACCESLKSIDVSKFNTKNATNLESTFYRCKVLTSLDLSNWDVSNVTDMLSMFTSCSSLASLTLSNNWASNESVTEVDLSACPLTHDSCLDVFNKLATRTNSPTLILKSTTKTLMSDAETVIATNKGWVVK